MRWSRRCFLRIAGGLLAGLGGAAQAATQQPRSRLLEVHEATRNTRLRALAAHLGRAFEDTSRQHRYAGKRVDLSTQALGEDELALDAAARRYSPASAFDGKPIALPDLARLLHLTNGVTGRSGQGEWEVKLRAAPSAGALYAGEVYVVAERVTGLESGVYHFSPLGLRLVRLRRGSVLDTLHRAFEQPERVTGAAAIVVLTNVFRRYRSRYGARGYRYALIDSGHIGENLRLAATARGLSDWSPLRFRDDSFHTLLELDGVDEAVCAVHAIGHRKPSRSLDPGSPRFAEKALPTSALPGARDAVEAYHEATKLVPAENGHERQPASNTKPHGRKDEGDIAHLPHAVRPTLRCGEAIERRRSPDAFGTRSVTLEELAFVLETSDGRASLRRAPSVELHVAAHRVVGVAPGLYRYAPGTHELRVRRRGALASALVEACLGQDKAGTAAAALFMVGRLHEAAERGDRAYRDLLIEAGAIGQRIYLSAEALGLSARNLAAFYDGDLNALLRLTPPDRAVLHLTLLGHEEQDRAADTG